MTSATEIEINPAGEWKEEKREKAEPPDNETTGEEIPPDRVSQVGFSALRLLGRDGFVLGVRVSF